MEEQSQRDVKNPELTTYLYKVLYSDERAYGYARNLIQEGSDVEGFRRGMMEQLRAMAYEAPEWCRNLMLNHANSADWEIIRQKMQGEGEDPSPEGEE